MTGPAHYFVLPGDPETPTGGFVYDRHVLRALRQAGRLAGTVVLSGQWPQPGPATEAAAERAMASLPDGARVIVDGLAFSPLLEVFAAAADRLALFALIHHPLGDETGVSPALRRRLDARERDALALVRGVVVTSAHTAERLAAFAVPPERIRVVRPGIDIVRPRRSVHSAGISGGGPLLLSVASLTPRKGQDVLLRALVRLRDRPWRLLLAGPPLDRAYAGHLRRLARDLRLGRRIAFIGAVETGVLAGLYAAADVFVFPSHYEGYGMAAAEAAAHSLPIVATDAGAIAEATSGARRSLVPPGRADALADALRAALANTWAEAGAGRRAARSWARTGREFIAAIDDLCASFRP